MWRDERERGGHVGHFIRRKGRKVVSEGWEDNFSNLRGGHWNFSNIKGTLYIKTNLRGGQCNSSYYKSKTPCHSYWFKIQIQFGYLFLKIVLIFFVFFSFDFFCVFSVLMNFFLLFNQILIFF